jgi:hypothetical protein
VPNFGESHGPEYLASSRPRECGGTTTHRPGMRSAHAPDIEDVRIAVFDVEATVRRVYRPAGI